MPYARNDDLPPAVRRAYSAHCQTVFRNAWNAAFDQYDDEGRAFATAHAAAKRCEGTMKAKTAVPLKATILDEDHFRLLAIPFGGPIPMQGAPMGVDLDGEWFSMRTEIKPEWLPFRIVDWQHGQDPHMGRSELGKADNLVMDEDGWWVDVWLRRGEERVALVRKLAERGAQLFGSSESIAGMVEKASTGEILRWPYWRQTLAVTPQNTYSVLRSVKAALEDAITNYSPTPAFWRDLVAGLDDLDPDHALTFGNADSDGGAKAGRVLSAANEGALRDALEALGMSVGRLNEVLAKLRKE